MADGSSYLVPPLHDDTPSMGIITIAPFLESITVELFLLTMFPSTYKQHEKIPVNNKHWHHSPTDKTKMRFLEC